MICACRQEAWQSGTQRACLQYYLPCWLPPCQTSCLHAQLNCLHSLYYFARHANTSALHVCSIIFPVGSHSAELLVCMQAGHCSNCSSASQIWLLCSWFCCLACMLSSHLVSTCWCTTFPTRLRARRRDETGITLPGLQRAPCQGCKHITAQVSGNLPLHFLYLQTLWRSSQSHQ